MLYINDTKLIVGTLQLIGEIDLERAVKEAFLDDVWVFTITALIGVVVVNRAFHCIRIGRPLIQTN